MGTITIYPDKVIRSFDEKDSKDKWIDAEDLVYYLGDEVKLEGVTLGRVMDLLKEDIEFYYKVFYVELGGFRLDAFLDDMDAPVEGEDDRHSDGSSMDCIEVGWRCEIWDWNEGTPELELFTDFHGIGKGADGTDTSWALEFTPLSRLRDYPLRIEEKLTIFQHKSKKVTIDNKIDVQKDFLLRDIFCAILEEISFCGYPEGRDMKHADLLDTVEEAKEQLKDGTLKLIDHEDVAKELGFDKEDEEDDTDGEPEVGSGSDC